jgi:hypothetical protein
MLDGHYAGNNKSFPDFGQKEKRMGVYYYLFDETEKMIYHLDDHVKVGPITRNFAVQCAFINVMFKYKDHLFRIVTENEENYEEIDLLVSDVLDNDIHSIVIKELNSIYGDDRYKERPTTSSAWLGEYSLRKREGVHDMVDGCEWNPDKNRPVETHEESHAQAEVILGNGVWRVCSMCAKLPVFSGAHYRITPIIRAASNNKFEPTRE